MYLDVEMRELPQAVRALARKYPACSSGDFSSCKSGRTKAMMEDIMELTEIHPIYSLDRGEEKLWRDLQNVAISALLDDDDALEALEDFLKASLEETRGTTLEH